MRINRKKLILIVLVIIASILLPNNIYAREVDGIDDMIHSADEFIDIGKGDSVINDNALRDTSGYIWNTLFTIAIVIAFAIGMIIGIQFITGSVEEKAKIKETLIPYIVGVFVVFASFTIWKVVVNIGNRMEDTTAMVEVIQDEKIL